MKNISIKELNYLNDFMSWELLAAKKCYQYGCQENNSPHQQLFFEAARVHQQNYTNLLNHIDRVYKNQGGQLQ